MDLIDSVMPSNKIVHMFIVSDKTLHVIKPLNGHGFWIRKNFYRKFSDLVMSEKVQIDLFHGDNIFKIQSISHH